MGKTAVLIITDEGFLAPSLVLARQIEAVERYRTLADVLLFTVDLDPALFAYVQKTFASDQITVTAIDSAALGLPEQSGNFRGHVPRTCLSRLSILDFVPGEYTEFVYLDGDTRLVGDIGPLLQLRVPDGRIAACVENFILFENADGSGPDWLEQDLSVLGLNKASDYFNSGVLAFNRATWTTLGPEALSFYLDNEDICRHHDQSALNAICAGEWLRLSPAYNFQTFFLDVAAAKSIDRRLLHFSSSPKPWASPDSRWPSDHARPYRDLVQTHPMLTPTIRVYDAPGPLNRMVRAVKRALRAPRATAAKNENFRRYMASTPFDLA